MAARDWSRGTAGHGHLSTWTSGEGRPILRSLGWIALIRPHELQIRPKEFYGEIRTVNRGSNATFVAAAALSTDDPFTLSIVDTSFPPKCSTSFPWASSSPNHDIAFHSTWFLLDDLEILVKHLQSKQIQKSSSDNNNGNNNFNSFSEAGWSQEIGQADRRFHWDESNANYTVFVKELTSLRGRVDALGCDEAFDAHMAIDRSLYEHHIFCEALCFTPLAATVNPRMSFSSLSNESCESLAYYGMSTNLVNYMKSHLSEGNVVASMNVNNWSGICYIKPLLGAFVADAYQGRYRTIASFIVIYIFGLGTDLYVVKGIGIGHEIVKAKLLVPQLEHVEEEITLIDILQSWGLNFVIKYECSFKYGESEYFVLEHVEHDRPEYTNITLLFHILKKEIGVFELQWYGFCMFKALASLHKQIPICLFKCRLEWMTMKCGNKDPKNWLHCVKKSTS
ncbi:hypothetical protein KFK09_007983 [Dendrobium nobile]|uniref:Uncharacterized protein n=1 Tax=Dendrobium nobile TaxID=94219 RepID=A0A8T3BY48_DENNO|nr:hypothetical protein KFK09_007983 [Dendrobium nobile]